MKLSSFYQFILIIFWACISQSPASAPIIDFDDPEQVYENFYAVHLSPILLRDSTAIPGALTNGKLSPQDLINIKTRVTLHHTLNGTIPEDLLAHAYFEKGVKVHSSVPEDHTYKYAYLDKFKNFKGEIAGGSLYDLFTVGNHCYGQDSIMIIPKDEKYSFRILNPHFKGRTVFYNREKSLKETVSEVLDQEKVMRYGIIVKPVLVEQDNTLVSEPDISFESHHIPNLTEKSVNFFKTQSYYAGVHSGSEFYEIESYLQYFNQIFLTRYNEDTLLQRTITVLPTGYIPVLKALILRQFEKVFLLSFSPKVINFLKQWQDDVCGFINIHEIDSHLRRTQQKSLFFCSPGLWPEILKARSDPEKLIKMGDELLPLHPSELAIIESQGYRWQFEDNKIINQRFLSGIPRTDSEALLDGHTLFDFSKPDTNLIKSFCLLHKYICLKEDLPDIKLHQIYKQLAENLPLALDHYPSFFKNYFYHLLVGYVQNTIELFNQPELKSILAKAMGLKDIESDITHNELLWAFPHPRLIFDQTDDIFLNIAKSIYLSSVDPKWSPLIYDSLFSRVHRFVFDIHLKPINALKVIPNSQLLQQTMRCYPPIYSFEGACEFSVDPDKFFQDLGVGDAYRKKFPTKAEFLNYLKADGTSPTYPEVYRELKKIQDQKS